MKKEITYEDYDKIQICVGTILEASINEKARKPAYVLKIDFGEKIGIKTSSAQITSYYKTNELRCRISVLTSPPRPTLLTRPGARVGCPKTRVN